MLIVSTLVLAATGSGAGLLWSRLPFVQMPMVMVYGVLVHALWFAPLYAWILFVSAWARRMPVAVGGAAARWWWGWRSTSRSARRSSAAAALALMGAMGRAFDTSTTAGWSSRSGPHAPRFLASPGLWGGLLVAALCVAGAIHFRRVREPN
jgi:ABC-2 type transport system permease protein